MTSFFIGYFFIIIVLMVNEGNKYNTDEALVAGIRKCEEAAYRKLRIDYFDMIENLVLKNSGTATEASDIFQEVQISLWENVCKPSFNLTSTLKTYIFSIGRNKWFKVLKGKGKTTPTMPGMPGNNDGQADGGNPYRGIWEKSILPMLKDKCKEILMLFYINQLKMKDIAQEMGYANADVAKKEKNLCMNKARELGKNSGDL